MREMPAIGWRAGQFFESGRLQHGRRTRTELVINCAGAVHLQGRVFIVALVFEAQRVAQSAVASTCSAPVAGLCAAVSALRAVMSFRCGTLTIAGRQMRRCAWFRHAGGVKFVERQLRLRRRTGIAVRNSCWIALLRNTFPGRMIRNGY